MRQVWWIETRSNKYGWVSTSGRFYNEEAALAELRFRVSRGENEEEDVRVQAGTEDEYFKSF